ncbi:MAG: mannosyltransferase [Candidatus Aenigmatarchaeota archaeon]|nr:MAG: mannosyltransferase [Candidatus Aenigmarchaeota archaeon]
MPSILPTSKILFMGTFPPRECGIATFTQDLSTSIDRRFSPKIKSKILAMNKNETNIYNYHKDVIFQIDDSDLEKYIKTAKKINKSKTIKLVNVQHEFGIFGGDEYGCNIIPFLEVINKPVIVTFHSVLPEPNERLRRVVKFISEKASCIVVMNHTAVRILRRDYGLKCDIEVIPHGIPGVKFSHSKTEKRKLGLSGRTVMTSFGLMSKGKGYEHVIEALPNVVEKIPDLLYIIVGETHPVVRANEGEDYRNSLERKVKELGLKNNVRFYNKYVTLDEIIQYLKASDIYISSSTNPNQICSGTLVYAMGCGRAVVSTPFLHAKEYVTPERGALAEFGNPQSFADAILSILTNKELKKSMEKNAYAFTRSMIWPNVALSYVKLFDRYIKISDRHEAKLPKIKFSHIANMTDDFGIMQFARYTTPDKKFGYCVDDNSRALMVACMHYKQFGMKPKLKLARTYLNFIKHVFRGDGTFCNFVDYDRNKNEEDISEDSFGRTVASLGYLVSVDRIPDSMKNDAEEMLRKSSMRTMGLKSPRSIAFSIIGLHHYHNAKPSEYSIGTMKKLADRLLKIYKDNATDEWHWFENMMTYSNARMPEALFYAYISTKDKRYLHVAKKTLDFLISVTFENGIYEPIGQNGWYSRNGMKARFDQQPVDTASMVQALLLAYEVTGDAEYKKKAITAFNWFLGKNHLEQMVYDEFTGGCHDGLSHMSVNLNQGAESTISYLLARLALEESMSKES